MNTWIARWGQRLPQWLARDSASAWIMAGTLAFAGGASTALAATAAGLSAPAATVPAVGWQFSMQHHWGCHHGFGAPGSRTVTASGQQACGGAFRHAWQHGQWNQQGQGQTADLSWSGDGPTAGTR